MHAVVLLDFPKLLTHPVQTWLVKHLQEVKLRHDVAWATNGWIGRVDWPIGRTNRRAKTECLGRNRCPGCKVGGNV